LGSMTAECLGLSVEYYDPHENLEKVRYQFVGGVPGGIIARRERSQPYGLSADEHQSRMTGFTTTVHHTEPSSFSEKETHLENRGFQTIVIPESAKEFDTTVFHYVESGSRDYGSNQPQNGEWSRTKYRH